MGHRRRSRWLGTAAIVAVTLALAGCTGARSDFAREFRGDTAIAELELTTGDNMPFTAGVRATVTTADDLDADATSALLSRLSAFVREHTDEPVRITVHRGGLTVPVFGDEDRTRSAMHAATTIAADNRVDSVALFGATESERISSIAIQVSSDIGGAFALMRSAALSVTDIATPRVYIAVRDAGSLIRIEGPIETWLDDAEAAWANVSAHVPVSGVRADEESFTLQLTDETDVAAAQRLVEETTAGTLPITFASPLVQLGLDGTGDEVRAMLAQLDEQVRPLIRMVWTTDTRAVFYVAAEEQIPGVERALHALPTGGLEVSVSVEGG